MHVQVTHWRLRILHLNVGVSRCKPFHSIRCITETNTAKWCPGQREASQFWQYSTLMVYICFYPPAIPFLFVCLHLPFPRAGHFNSIIIFKAVINTQWLRKRRILVATTELQFKDSRRHCRKHIFKYSFVTQSTKYLIAHGFPGVPCQERGAGQRTARSPGRTTFPLRCRSPWAPVFRRCTSSFS